MARLLGASSSFFWFFDQVANAQQSFAERRLRRGFAGEDAVEVRFVAGNFLDSDRASAGSFVNFDELPGGGIRAGDQHVARSTANGSSPTRSFRDQDRMAEAERLFLFCRV